MQYNTSLDFVKGNVVCHDKWCSIELVGYGLHEIGKVSKKCVFLHWNLLWQCRMSHHVINVEKMVHVCKGTDYNRHIAVTLDGPTYSFRSFDHLYCVACAIHGFSACDACFWGFEEKDIALAKMTFDGWMPRVNECIGSAVLVRIGVVLQLGGALVCRHDRVTKSHTFVWFMMYTGGDTNGPPFGHLLCSLILVL
jgi:hypothetical protein